MAAPSRNGAAKSATFARGALFASLALAALTLGTGSAGAHRIPRAAGATRPITSQQPVLVRLTASPDAAPGIPPGAKLPSICVPLPPAPRLWTPAQLADPRVPGHAYDALGRVSRCEWNGLMGPQPSGGAPRLHGQVILVSLTQQWFWAYQDGRLVFANPITSGRPGLATPPGIYHVQTKVADTTFYSPWGPWSPYYYTPEHVNYALLFRAGGYYLHDAPWRAAFGSGSNLPHTDPGGGRESGSHGCVNMTTAAAAWLYHWAAIGATVLIVA